MVEEGFFNRKGEPISLAEYADLSSDRAYKVVKQEMVGDYFVSTVWLGSDHSYKNPVPIIFETMIFDRSEDSDSFIEEYMDRYATEEDALKGHAKAVEIAKEMNDGTFEPNISGDVT